MNRLTQPANRHKAIAAVLVSFVLLSTTYSVVTPISEAPDELQHYFFVQHLAEREGLAIGAAVINAFNPQFAFISGTITS